MLRGVSRHHPQIETQSLSRAYNTTLRQRAESADFFPSQLQDPSTAAILSSIKPPHPPQTLTEKIIQRHAVGLEKGQYVRAGDFVGISPAYCMSHDNSWPIALKFMSIGASKIANPGQVVMTLDHDVQNESKSNLKKYKQIEEFAKKHGVDFYERGRGIGHQIMVESGYAWPGSLVVASDSHSNMYGGVGCLGTPIVRTDAASIWATGRTWWQVPQIAQVRFTGVLPLGVTGKEYVYLSPFFHLNQLFVFPDSVVSILDICHNTQHLSLKQALLTAKFY